MAGHSKWKNIRLRKGKQDALRGNLFTKLSREIIVAAKMGGGDMSMNPRLRVAVDKAKAASVPKDNIDRAIKRGTGELEGVSYEELTYEGYGPAGSAIILECYSENKNRTVAEVRHAFTKHGGNMGENGSVGWQFKHVGQIVVPSAGLDEDEFTLAALEAGAEDVTSDDESFTVITAMEDLHRVSQELEKAGHKATEIDLTYLPTNKADLTQEDQVKLLKLLDALDDLDDVQKSHVNVDISDEAYEEE
ncbi:MAG: YebC/PmpR family DNA-binding transcriptional regulator [Myxococcales bacterium]|nr:MAG: YebC/PmpR family DNA-binding transcriptional regulator [Myxococcales bacterium]